MLLRNTQETEGCTSGEQQLSSTGWGVSRLQRQQQPADTGTSLPRKGDPQQLVPKVNAAVNFKGAAVNLGGRWMPWQVKNRTYKKRKATGR